MKNGVSAIRRSGLDRREQPPERDPRLRLVDAVLDDLTTRSAMYVGRRLEDGDVDTFVIQTGSEGRFRLSLPDLNSDASIEAVAAKAQAHLERVLGVPVPLCPWHEHALRGIAERGKLTWACPEGKWHCALGDYEERTWPQLDLSSLAPILARRLHGRGTFRAVQTISVTPPGDERVAVFGLVEENAELLRILAEVAAPLPIRTYEAPDVVYRPMRLSD